MPKLPKYTLEQLESLPIVKEFHIHNHAEKVYLLKGKIVKKTYPLTEENIRYYKKEIKMMTHLKRCPFVAKLIHHDKETLTMYMTYCGKIPKRTAENRLKIRLAAELLHKKWGVVRHDNEGRIQYDIYIPNTGIKGGKIHFFDLASDKWSITKPQSKSKPTFKSTKPKSTKPKAKSTKAKPKSTKPKSKKPKSKSKK